MVKKAFILPLLILFFFACATTQAPPPSLHIGQIPPAVAAQLSLEERIAAEDAWNDLNQGRAARAEKKLSKLGSQSPLYHAGLGYVHMLMNNLAEAERFFRLGLKEHPELALLHSGLAQVYQKTGRNDRAFAEYREVLKTEPKNPWALEQYKTLQNRKTGEALDAAKSCLKEGNTEKSKEFFLKALYYSPRNLEANLALADIYKKENKLQNALVHLSAAISADPENRDLIKDYAETLYQAGRYTKSLSVYEELQKLEPENKSIVDRIESIRTKLGIFELPSRYETISLSAAVTKEEIAALLAVKFKGIVDELAGTPPIVIDIATSWAQRFILQMTALGMLDIYPNHTFQPKKIISRAEMAETLYRFIGHLQKKGYTFIQQIPPDKIQMADVSPHHYYYQPILTLLSLNIMELTYDRSFQPELPVSGEQAIRYLDLILALIKSL